MLLDAEHFLFATSARTICLWNRVLGNAPKVPKHPAPNWIRHPIVLIDPAINPNKRLYLALAVIESLLCAVNPESTWHWRLKELMDHHPAVSRAHMGMPNDWTADPFWRFDGQEFEVHA
jgi:hypothetical protein